MSWVSYSKLQTLCQALRNKFTTGELVIANDDKSIGAHFNHTAQDGLVTLSPIVEDGTTPAALWVTDSAANNATELTGGTLSYVTNVGKDTEDYTSLSLVGGVVNVSGKSGVKRRITNVADPVDDNDAVNKKSIANFLVSEVQYPSLSVGWEKKSSSVPFEYSYDNSAIDYNAIPISLKKGFHLLSIQLIVDNTDYYSVMKHTTSLAAYDASNHQYFIGLFEGKSAPQYSCVSVYCPTDITKIEFWNVTRTSSAVTTLNLTFKIIADLYLGE